MMFLEFVFKTYSIINSKDKTTAASVLKLSFEARAFEWRAVFTVFYPFEFTCLSAAKLLVLDRLLDFAAPQGHDMRSRIATLARIVMGLVVLCNAFGLIANLVGAVYFTRAADAARASSAYYFANVNTLGDAYLKDFQVQLNRAVSIVSYQAFSEAAVLLLIVAVFVASGFLCARRVSSRLLSVDSASHWVTAGRHLWLQIVGTTAFVFVAFLVRSAFSAMFAVAQGLQDLDNPKCTDDNRCKDSCFNMFTHMTIWMLLTPQFQMTIILVSSPLALLVALWGMTSRRAIQLLRSNQQELASARATMLQS